MNPTNSALGLFFQDALNEKVSFSNLDLTLSNYATIEELNTKVSSNIFNSNTQATNEAIHLKLDETIYESNTQITNIKIDEKANSNNPTFTGTITADNTTVVLGSLNSIIFQGTSLQDTLNSKANNFNPIFTGDINAYSITNFLLPSTDVLYFNNSNLTSILDDKATISQLDLKADLSLVDTKADLSYVNTSLNTKANLNIFNSNTQATNIKINDRVLQSVYNSNTQITNLKIAEIDNSSGYSKEETDELLNLKENKATIITNVVGGCNTWLLTSTIINMIEPNVTLIPEIHFEERVTPYFTTTSNIVLPSDWNSNEWLLSASSSENTPDYAMRFQGNNPTPFYWDSGNISTIFGDINAWWQVQFPCNVYISSFEFGAIIGAYGRSPIEFQLQYSNDGFNFTTLQDYYVSVWNINNTFKVFGVTNPATEPYRWWRIQINKIGEGLNRASLHRLAFNCQIPYTLIPPVLVSNNQFKLTLADSLGYVLQSTNKSITFDIIVQTITGDIYKGSYIISNDVVINKTEQIIQSLEILGINTFTLSYANSIALKIFNTLACSFSSQIDTIKRVIRDLITPVGCIIIWSGTTNNIPVGWAICDGQIVNGFTTPDLRGRFVICSGEGYDSGTTGGSETQTLTVSNMPAHTHTGTTASAGAHTHQVQMADGPTVSGAQNIGRVDANNINAYRPTTSAGAHTHTFTTASTGSGTAFSIVPQYYSLIYIVKV
jgi:microcystin-dependent protein